MSVQDIGGILSIVLSVLLMSFLIVAITEERGDGEDE